MNMAAHATSGQELAERLRDAVNRHDLDGLVSCFAEDFVNETPVHPARSFRGRDQVRRNWAQILGGVPDLTTEILRSSSTDDAVWIEWEMRGTRRDGVDHLMRGVTVFGVADGLFSWVRFYLEPVQLDQQDVGAAIRQAVGS